MLGGKTWANCPYTSFKKKPDDQYVPSNNRLRWVVLVYSMMIADLEKIGHEGHKSSWVCALVV